MDVSGIHDRFLRIYDHYSLKCWTHISIRKVSSFIFRLESIHLILKFFFFIENESFFCKSIHYYLPIRSMNMLLLMMSDEKMSKINGNYNNIETTTRSLYGSKVDILDFQLVDYWRLNMSHSINQMKKYFFFLLFVSFSFAFRYDSFLLFTFAHVEALDVVSVDEHCCNSFVFRQNEKYNPHRIKDLFDQASTKQLSLAIWRCLVFGVLSQCVQCSKCRQISSFFFRAL